MKKPRKIGAFNEAGDGTRTLLLLKNENGAFTRIPFKRLVYAPFAFLIFDNILSSLKDFPHKCKQSATKNATKSAPFCIFIRNANPSGAAFQFSPAA